jgi:REP element-mobilizing transposase RayT
MDEYKEFYRRKLPHFHSIGSSLFITFRLAGSIPKKILHQYVAERSQIDHRQELVEAGLVSDDWLEFHRAWFKRFEDVLDRAGTGPVWLANAAVASIVFDAFLHGDKVQYDLFALCLMSNHGHVVLRPRLEAEQVERSLVDGEPKYLTSQATLGKIMKSLKGYTARMANRELGRTGKFWEIESYDHQVRDDAEFFRVVRYTLQNPVKARLVNSWQEWQWTYLRGDLRPYFKD